MRSVLRLGLALLLLAGGATAQKVKAGRDWAPNWLLFYRFKPPAEWAEDERAARIHASCASAYQSEALPTEHRSRDEAVSSRLRLRVYQLERPPGESEDAWPEAAAERLAEALRDTRELFGFTPVREQELRQSGPPVVEFRAEAHDNQVDLVIDAWTYALPGHDVALIFLVPEEHHRKARAGVVKVARTFEVLDIERDSRLRKQYEEETFTIAELGGIGRGKPHLVGGREWAVEAQLPLLQSPQPALEGKRAGAVAAAVTWLREHQHPEGFWSTERFMDLDDARKGAVTDGAGKGTYDIGVTGLALRALLAAGVAPTDDAVVRAASWLVSVQEPDGVFGRNVGNPTIYCHAMALQAIAEARIAGVSVEEVPDKTLALGVEATLRAQNEGSGWRYSLTADGRNDTSVTGWCAAALVACEVAGAKVPESAYAGTLAWYELMTLAKTGRTGYANDGGFRAGSLPARTPEADRTHPRDLSESLTALTCWSRLQLAARVADGAPTLDALRRQIKLILERLPSEETESHDYYYWYYASLALAQWGGRESLVWRTALDEAVLDRQRDDGNFAGSWDPVGAWGTDGGRVYTTAILSLTLTSEGHYARLLR